MIYKEQVHHTAPSQTLLFSFFAAENLNMFINTNQFQPNRTDAVCSISRNRIFAVIDTLIGTSDFYFLFIEFPSQNDITVWRLHNEREFIVTPIFLKPEGVGGRFTEAEEIVDPIHHMAFAGV